MHNREETEAVLKDMINNLDINDISDAAIHVLANALDYDYLDKDRDFLFCCEEIVAEKEAM